MRGTADFGRFNRVVTLVFALAFSLAGCRTRATGEEKQPAPARSPALTGARLPAQAAGEDDGQWLMPAKNYASTRYSALAQINVRNVHRLKVAWTFSTGNVRGHEAAMFWAEPP